MILPAAQYLLNIISITSKVFELAASKFFWTSSHKQMTIIVDAPGESNIESSVTSKIIRENKPSFYICTLISA